MGITGPTTWLGLVVVVALFYGAEGFVGIIWRRMSVQRLLPSQVVDLMLQNGIKNMRIPHSVSVHRGRNLLLQLGRLVCPDYDLNWGALNYVQTALNEVGLGRTKANIVHCAAELIPNITNPSEAAFHDIIKDRMSQFLRFMRQHNAPFQYDYFVWALEKLNFSDIKVVVMAVGWPTDGYPGASAYNTERYYKYLLPMVTSNKGSLMRPGAPIDVFINSSTNEPKQRIDVLAPFDRHLGDLQLNGQPKFKVDLSGRGRDIYPTTVKGIMHMPKRWCVFNGNSTDKDKDEKACNFEGLSCITDQDPSTEDCLFPVEVVRG
ncbi:glucan endo-1,3-beta-glucosidase 8-like [Salvia splendens]|uniref:glucan endo-1,3-beta-glucosidase 8-like n=1 Tax=Salvia splendens TaxID=180675 RepID=UPI001C271A1C|nr:glucan endo-1,3-beta-glucosidase 8-like [Salvia splendens]